MQINRIGLIALAVCFFGFFETCFACSVDSSGPMPICEAPLFEDNERIVVIRLGQMLQYTNIDVIVEPYGGELNAPKKPMRIRGIWDSLAQESFDQHTYLADIKIDALKAPVTLVLSSYDATIVRISSNARDIRRIIVLGSRRYGPGAIGIVGVDKSKIEYVPVKGRNETRQTICGAPPNSCAPSQFLKVHHANRGYNDIHSAMPPYENLHSVAASSSLMMDYKGKMALVGMFSDTNSIDIVEGISGLEIKLDKSRQDRLNAINTPNMWKSIRTQQEPMAFFFSVKFQWNAK